GTHDQDEEGERPEEQSQDPAADRADQPVAPGQHLATPPLRIGRAIPLLERNTADADTVPHRLGTGLRNPLLWGFVARGPRLNDRPPVARMWTGSVARPPQQTGTRTTAPGESSIDEYKPGRKVG